MSFSPCTKRSHAPYTAASFALRDTDSSRWTPDIRDRPWSARRYPWRPSVGTPRLPPPTTRRSRDDCHISTRLQGFSARREGQFRPERSARGLPTRPPATLASRVGDVLRCSEYAEYVLAGELGQVGTGPSPLGEGG